MHTPPPWTRSRAESYRGWARPGRSRMPHLENIHLSQNVQREVTMKFYTFFRSSAAYRVRIALGFKGLEVDQRFVRLSREGGDQQSLEYAALNPQRLIPLLVDQDFVLNQSLAILEYLEELHPRPALLPGNPRGRARVRALASMICCDIHPLQNSRVQRYLGSELGHDEATVLAWVRHWIDDGLLALESMIASDPKRGDFCYDGHLSFADACLVPQLYNARRYGCDLARYPTLVRIGDACDQLDAFRNAAPERQPDAP
jgi:maleylpyruvate isomerase